MLWTAIFLTRLPLDCIPQAPDCAFAVVEKRRIAAANALALAAGVRTGQSLAAALALLPALAWAEREPVRETTALQELSLWALQFSSCIALAPPQCLVLESGASRTLFGGLEPLLAHMSAGLKVQGFAASFASAPTPTGARMLACSGFDAHPATSAALRAALPGLPVSCLTSAAGFKATFEALGLATVADLLALPRDGLARRFGPHVADELDRALGLKPDPVRPIVLPDTFRSTITLPAPAESASALQFAFERAFRQLEGFLHARKQAIDRIDLTLHHERASRPAGDAPRQEQVLSLNFFEPTAAAGRFMLILRERLNQVSLERRVERITVGTSLPVEAPEATRALLPEPVRASQGLKELLERLHARLGAEAICGIESLADHRPARAGVVCPQASPSALPAHAPDGRARPGQAAVPAWGPRPVWLIEPPRPLAEIGGKPHHDGPLTLLTGPERIESGWWDGAAVTRDYFIARTGAHALVWIFRERGLPVGWFLQGYFG